MNLRKTLLLFGAGLMLGQTLQLEQMAFAQVTKENANPAHEKIKTEADNHYKKGEYAKTIELSSQVIQLNEKDDVAYYLRGSANVELGLRTRNIKFVRDGIGDARKAIELNGQKHINYYLPYIYGMSSLSVLEGRNEHAEVAVQVAGQVLNLAQITEDEKANLLYQRARTQTQLGKHNEAAQDFEAALRFNSMHMGAFLGSAHAYASAGNFPKAEQQFDKAIQTFPNNPIVHNDRGMFRQQRKKFAEALADFTRVVELQKNAYYAYTNRGFTLMEQGNPQAAEADFNSSLQIEPDQAMVYSFRGTARLEQGKLADATADYQKVVQLDPNNPVAKADLGFALFFAENYNGASQQFEAATKINKGLKHLYPWHLVALQQSRASVNLSEKFTPVLKKEVKEWDWADQLLAYQLGHLKEDQLLESTKGDDVKVTLAQQCEAYFFIAQKYASEGNMQQAVAYFRKSVETNVKNLSAYRGAQGALKRLNIATSNRNPFRVD